MPVLWLLVRHTQVEVQLTGHQPNARGGAETAVGFPWVPPWAHLGSPGPGAATQILLTPQLLSSERSQAFAGWFRKTAGH